MQIKIAPDDFVSIPHISNGLWPLEMTALACAGLVFAVCGRKLIMVYEYRAGYVTRESETVKRDQWVFDKIVYLILKSVVDCSQKGAWLPIVE